MLRRNKNKTNKAINLRYSLMKCDRRSTNNSRRVAHREEWGYSTREPAISKFNSDIPFSNSTLRTNTLGFSVSKVQNRRNIYFIYSLLNKSRTLALSSGVTNKRSNKRVRTTKENENSNNKRVNKIPDCTIYFPLTGILGKDNSKYKRKPKFIIVPKDEYVKNHPGYLHSRKTSVNNALSNKGNKRVTLPEYDRDAFSHAEESSPRSLPKKILFEKRGKASAPRYATREKILEFRKGLKQKKNIQKMRESLRNKTKNKRNHIFDPLVRRKAKHAHNYNRKYSAKGEQPTYDTTNSTQEGTMKQRDKMFRSKLNQSNNISSGYGDIIKLIQKKKGRIQSAHPVMKQNHWMRKNNSNLNASLTYSKKTSSTRPMSSAKYNMNDYLGRVIEMAKKEWPDSKHDISRLIRIKERYATSRPTEDYHKEEIRDAISQILQKIGN